MSYILDALRRADAERERGSVPTVHAHPAAAGTPVDGASTRRARPWLWVGGLALLLLVLGAGLGQWLSRAGGGPAPVVISAAPPLPAPPQQQQQQQQAPPPPVAALPDPVAAVREPPRPAAPVAVRKPPVAAAAPRVEPPALVERPVPPISALPEDLRRQLPALTASGAMYSEAPANRMLIINGQLLHEGDRVAPDLVLEQIKLRGAVLSFKGQRFRISY